MLRFLSMLAIVLIAPVAAHATKLYGLGLATCATFDTHYDKDPNLTSLTYYSWYQGFLSSMNLALHANGKLPVDYDTTGTVAQDEMDFLHDYCMAHPDRTFTHAALKLISNHQHPQPERR